MNSKKPHPNFSKKKKKSDFIFVVGDHLIAKGDYSKEFYFYTLPTSPPLELECETSYDSVTPKWKNPTIGLKNGTEYKFIYNLQSGKH